MKTSMTSKYATQISLGFAKDEIDMSYQPTWREWNFAVAMTFVIHVSQRYKLLLLLSQEKKLLNPEWYLIPSLGREGQTCQDRLQSEESCVDPSD